MTQVREITDRHLLDARDDIRDMSQRVLDNGPEVHYASEKLGHALFKAAEGLALCDIDLDAVLEQVRRGWARGEWLAGRPR